MLRTIAISAVFVLASQVALADTCVVVGYKNGNQYDGPTFCGNGEEGAIGVNGTLTTSGTTFIGDVTVMGPISATNTLYQNIVISSSQCEFTGTKVSNIEELNNGSGVQQVYLKSSTAVQSIKFDASNGEVYIDSSSSVGKVTGGKIIHN